MIPLRRFLVPAAVLAFALLASPARGQTVLNLGDSPFDLHPSKSGAENSDGIDLALDVVRDPANAGTDYVLLFPLGDPIPLSWPPAPQAVTYKIARPIDLYSADTNLVGIHGELAGNVPGGDNDLTRRGRHPAWPAPMVTLLNDNHTNTPGVLDSSDALIYISQCNGVTVKDLVIDGNVSQRPAGSLPPTYGIVLAGARSCKVKNVQFQNLGKKSDAVAGITPGGAQLLVISTEPGMAWSGFSEFVPNDQASRGSAFNGISQCRFTDVWGTPQCSFGVRFVTNWAADIAHGFEDAHAHKLLDPDKTKSVLQRAELSPWYVDDFSKILERNTVRHNDFSNGFFWNAVEIAGPATRENFIRNNSFVNTYQSPLDADKGASFNEFTTNLIDGVYPNNTASVGGGLRNKNAYALRDQGIGPTLSSSRAYLSRGYFNIHNQFVDNIVRDVKGKEENAAGAMLRLTQFGDYQLNQFEDFDEDQQSIFLFRDGVVSASLYMNSYAGLSGESLEGITQSGSPLLWLRYSSQGAVDGHVVPAIP